MVDQVAPASSMMPTRFPASSTTQFPAWTPCSAPLLRVRVEAQLELPRAVTVADSKSNSLRFCRSPSSVRSRSFSLLSASPSRALASSSAISFRSRAFSA